MPKREANLLSETVSSNWMAQKCKAERSTVQLGMTSVALFCHPHHTLFKILCGW